jgi:integrase
VRRASLTVGDWADDWLAAQADLAPTTRERYEGIISKHIRPRWGQVRLSDVTHAQVQRWVTGLGLAPASVRKTYRVLSMALAYAVKDGRLAVNPAAGVSLPRVRESERRFLTHRQVHELAEACGDEYKLMVFFLAYTGLRWGEMAALRVHRVDFLRRRVLVAESVTPVKGVMTFGPTKGHERREVPLPRFLIEELARHVSGRAADDLVFTGERGAIMRSGTFRRAALIEAAKAIGIPGFHPHELRHTAASLAIASGADVKVVQQMLGHKSATMTLDQYGHLFGDRLDIVADAMDAARSSALADVYPPCTTGEVVELRRDAK